MRVLSAYCAILVRMMRDFGAHAARFWCACCAILVRMLRDFGAHAARFCAHIARFWCACCAYFVRMLRVFCAHVARILCALCAKICANDHHFGPKKDQYFAFKSSANSSDILSHPQFTFVFKKIVKKNLGTPGGSLFVVFGCDMSSGCAIASGCAMLAVLRVCHVPICVRQYGKIWSETKSFSFQK